MQRLEKNAHRLPQRLCTSALIVGANVKLIWVRAFVKARPKECAYVRNMLLLHPVTSLLSEIIRHRLRLSILLKKSFRSIIKNLTNIDLRISEECQLRYKSNLRDTTCIKRCRCDWTSPSGWSRIEIRGSFITGSVHANMGCERYSVSKFLSANIAKISVRQGSHCRFTWEN